MDNLMDELRNLQLEAELTQDDPTWILTPLTHGKFLCPSFRSQISGSRSGRKINADWKAEIFGLLTCYLSFSFFSFFLPVSSCSVLFSHSVKLECPNLHTLYA
jgi:hypothetical protein